VIEEQLKRPPDTAGALDGDEVRGRRPRGVPPLPVTINDRWIFRVAPAGGSLRSATAL
jgi:hypothetical protein